MAHCGVTLAVTCHIPSITPTDTSSYLILKSSALSPYSGILRNVPPAMHQIEINVGLSRCSRVRRDFSKIKVENWGGLDSLSASLSLRLCEPRKKDQGPRFHCPLKSVKKHKNIRGQASLVTCLFASSGASAACPSSPLFSRSGPCRLPHLLVSRIGSCRSFLRCHSAPQIRPSPLPCLRGLLRTARFDHLFYKLVGQRSREESKVAFIMLLCQVSR